MSRFGELTTLRWVPMTGDLTLDDVAVREEDLRVACHTDAARGAGEDDVARHQAGEGRDVGQQVCGVEDQCLGVVVLHHVRR